MPTLDVTCFRLNGPASIGVPIEFGESGCFTIGRDPASDYVVGSDGKLVSRRQCTIARTDGRWTLTDGNGKASLNGTILKRHGAASGIEISNTVTLRDGDVIEFPARPEKGEKIWRWQFTFRAGPPDETIEEGTLIQPPTPKPYAKYLPWIAMFLVALAMVLLYSFVTTFVDNQQKLSPKEFLELIVAILAGAGALALKLKSGR